MAGFVTGFILAPFVATQLSFWSITPAPASSMTRAASRRAIPPNALDPSRSSSPTNHVGPSPRFASASSTTSSGVAAPGIGVPSFGVGKVSPVGQKPAQGRRVGDAEHQGQHVDPVPVQFGPQGLAHHHVEGLGGAVGDHSAGPDESGPGRDQDDASAPPFDHHSSKVMAQLHRHEAVASHHGLRRLHRGVEKVHEVGIGACAVHQETDVETLGALGDRVGGADLTEVDRQRAGLDRPSRTEIARHFLQYRWTARDQGDVQPTLGHGVGKGQADPLGGSGDQGPRPVAIQKIRHQRPRYNQVPPERKPYQGHRWSGPASIR